jgi:pre-rRNA-processing protein TSR3
MFPKTVIVRHRKENLKKCSLRGLEGREDLYFSKYHTPILPNLEGYVLLDLEGPPLSSQDRDKGLVLLDGTWRYASKMRENIPFLDDLPKRSLPLAYTAYPRRQEDCSEPERGLASVEALYLAYCILERDAEGLLDHYYWKDQFLQKNALLLSCL